EKGMTQRELAEALGKKEAEVSRWMRGTHNFTIRTLAKISNVLGTQIINVSN
ncbi:MAG: helix-turn-helix transcriptional regulator, partial [Alistipes sp.]|nr:helix-turn-helix transcriptional regulator [Alistipes sp.]